MTSSHNTLDNITSWKTTNELLDETVKNVLQLIDWVDADIQHLQENDCAKQLVKIDGRRRNHLKDALHHLNQAYK